MKTLQQLATLTPDQLSNEVLTQAHTGKVLSYIDEGLTNDQAIRRADDEMFAFMTAGDIFAGQDQEDFDF